MKIKSILALVLAAGFCLSMRAGAVQPSQQEKTSSLSWITAQFVGKSAKKPFSFVYNGRPSSQLLKSWNSTYRIKKIDRQRVQHILAYVDPVSSLQVRCVATEYRDYPAVEWVIYFRNGGKVDTAILEDVQALNADMGVFVKSGDFKLHYAEGSHALITDFQPLEKSIGTNDTIKLTSFRGRSSDGTLPFFNLAKPDGGGMVLGVGWTGQWAASFKRNGSGSVNVQAGMELTHFKLHPGEEVRSPAILAVFWGGTDYTRGQNLLRSVLLAHYSPTSGGKPVSPPIAASPHAVISFEKSSEKNTLEGINNLAAHRAPFDYWWIDAGWYTCANNWALWVGNIDPDPVRYPNGMKPVADAAHAAGMKFLLWFEPERVMRDTWLYKQHPDWLIKPPSDFPAELMYQYNDGFHLLNLGNPEALDWLKHHVSDTIGKVGIDCYRNDFNMYPSYYWHSGEDLDRQGINEIKYVTGLYEYFDFLKSEHPNLILDNCASGGRRIDFEMLRRSVVLTRSDYLWDPIGQQSHTYGLAQWVPITGIGAADTSVYNCRSGYGSHFALAADFYSKTPDFWSAVNAMLSELKSLKSLFTGDFYPLTRYSTSDGQWMAWQFDRSDTGQGLVQAFRRPKCSFSDIHLRLRGLDQNKIYEITDMDTKSTRRLAGSVLMGQGIDVTIPSSPGSAILRYKRLWWF